MVRAPALPIEVLEDLSAPSGSKTAPHDLGVEPLLDDPYVSLALSIGSSSLAEAWDARPLPDERSRRLLRPLLSYLVRMASRPTPFGLFAAVTQGEWGSRTELDLGGRPSIRRGRPDMAWLYALVQRFERDPAVRPGLVLRTHPTVRIRGGRVTVAGLDVAGSATGAAAITLRATPVVSQALELCRNGARYLDVERDLCSETGRDRAKTRLLLNTLCDRGFLVTNLRPSLIGSPAHDLLRSLRTAGGAPDATEAMARLLEDLAEWEKLPDAEALRAWGPLTRAARDLEPTSPSIQVDARFSAPASRLPPSVALEASRAVELLRRLSAWPGGPPTLAPWRERFESTYGRGRAVPVLELQGRGLPDGDPPLPRHSRRDQLLLEIAGAALHSRRRVVELDEERISELESAGGPRGRPPRSVDLFCGLAVASESELDAGRFQLVVNSATVPAGRSFGRFAHLFESAALEFLDEAPAAAPGAIAAEMFFEPLTAGSGNVMIRTPRATHAIHIGGAFPEGATQVIPLDELAVTLDGSRLRLLWTREGVHVTAGCSHMLNYRLAPKLARFLRAVSSDGETVMNRFSWGSAEHLPALPRLQAGRVVLRRAEWALDPSFLDAFRRDRAVALREAELPRQVLLGGTEQHLLLDLESDWGTSLLLAAGKRLRPRERLRVLEALPGTEHAFARGHDGHRALELVVPVARVDKAGDSDRVQAAGPTAVAARRLRPPGSEWLYAKLYTDPDLADELVGGPLRALTEELTADGRLSSWFFVRYSDPAFHIRLRLRGDPSTLTGSVLPDLCDWAHELMGAGLIDRFSLDTYERETERYGGPEAMLLAEHAFAADSVAAAALIAVRPAIAREIEWTHLGVWTVDDLLDALGLGPVERLDWCRQNHEIYAYAQDFREAKRTLRTLLDPNSAGNEGGARDIVRRVLGDRRAALQHVAAGLAELDRRDTLWLPLPGVARSLVHMHCNRLCPDGPEAEPVILGLAGLTMASLLAWPTPTAPGRPLDTGAQGR